MIFFRKVGGTFGFIYAGKKGKVHQFYMQFSLQNPWWLPRYERHYGEMNIPLYGWLFFYFGHRVGKKRGENTMGYQEFVVKTTEKDAEKDFKTIQKLQKSGRYCHATQVLETVAKLNRNVRLYDFDKTPDDWKVELEKDDLFLIVVGDRRSAADLIRQFSKRRPFYEIDMVVRCGGEEYDKIFTDKDILEYRKSKKPQF